MYREPATVGLPNRARVGIVEAKCRVRRALTFIHKLFLVSIKFIAPIPQPHRNKFHRELTTMLTRLFRYKSTS